MSSEKAAILKETIKNLGLQDIVMTPTQVADFNLEGREVRGVMMPKAFGIQGDKLSLKIIEGIPDTYFTKFEADIRKLSDAGIMIDLTKRSNFFYSVTKGFVFIDVDIFTGKSTGKFFEKDGKKMYYEFERFPYFPKTYNDSKELFLNAVC